MINGKSICLNMIVKDESAVIQRGLERLKPWIDEWVIVDTGSKDGTQEIIRDCLKDIPGELFERPWVNFGHNRNLALDLARKKADYILFADADDQYEISSTFRDQQLGLDYYYVQLQSDVVSYYRILMVKNDPGWFWEGVLHEYVTNLHPVVGSILPGIRCHIETQAGKRSQDPDKYLKDAAILEEALKEDPTNSRTILYLAQVYQSSNQLEKACQYYQMRASMSDMSDEVFWSLYSMGKIQQELQVDPKIYLESYFKAHHHNPSRAEPLFRIAFCLNRSGQYSAAYEVARVACRIPIPQFYMAIEYPVYDYGSLFELALSAMHLGHIDEANGYFDTLLQKQTLPSEIREQIYQLKIQ